MGAPTWLGITWNGNFNSGATIYMPLADGYCRRDTAETTYQQKFFTAGTLSNMAYSVTSDRSAITVTMRLDSGGGSANGNETITTTSSPVGQFADTTHTDTIANGYLVNLKCVNGTGGTTTTSGCLGAQFTATGTPGTCQVYRSDNQTNMTTASQTLFGMLSGTANVQATESLYQVQWAAAGTLKNLTAQATTNGRGTASTARSRVNTANGNLVATITASTPGLYADTTHSDTLTAGALVNVSLSTGTGAGTLLVESFTAECSSSAGAWHALQGNGTTAQFVATASTTSVIAWSGAGAVTATGSEASVQHKPRLAQALSHLTVNVSLNSRASSATDFHVRIGGTATAVVASVPALTTGQIADTTHSVTSTSTDLIDLDIVTGAGVENLTFQSTLVLATGAGDTSVGSIDGVSYPTNVANVLGLATASISNIDGLA